MNTNFEFLILGGYGQFVWPAFIFAFVSCFFLYLKTKKEMQKLEKMFLVEFKQIKAIKIETKQEAESLSTSPTF